MLKNRIYAFGLLDGFDGKYAVDFVEQYLVVNIYLDHLNDLAGSLSKVFSFSNALATSSNLNDNLKDKSDAEICELLDAEIKSAEKLLEKDSEAEPKENVVSVCATKIVPLKSIYLLKENKNCYFVFNRELKRKEQEFLRWRPC